VGEREANQPDASAHVDGAIAGPCARDLDHLVAWPDRLRPQLVGPAPRMRAFEASPMDSWRIVLVVIGCGTPGQSPDTSLRKSGARPV